MGAEPGRPEAEPGQRGGGAYGGSRLSLGSVGAEPGRLEAEPRRRGGGALVVRGGTEQRETGVRQCGGAAARAGGRP